MTAAGQHHQDSINQQQKVLTADHCSTITACFRLEIFMGGKKSWWAQKKITEDKLWMWLLPLDFKLSSVKPSALCGVEGIAQKKTNRECAWLGVIYFSKNSIFMVKVWTEVLSKDMENIILLTQHFSREILGKKKKHKAYVCCFLNIRKIELLSWCSLLVKSQFSSLYFTFLGSIN